MESRLPMAADTNITGRHGVTLIQERIEREGWIYRRQDTGDTDFGVDAEMEIVERNKVTGHLFKGQIKSSDGVEWKSDQAVVSVKVSTYNLWREMSLPTILFLVDTSSSGIYWTPALAHHPLPGRSSLSIRFEQSSNLQHGIAPLSEYLVSWFSVNKSDVVFDEVPYFHGVFEELRPDVDHYDPGSEMGEDDDGKLRLFYHHVLRLRLHLGFRNDQIPNLADWYAREAATWQSMGILSWTIFSELMKFLTPYYEEAIARLSERLSHVEYTAENCEIKNFIEKLHGRFTTLYITDGRSKDKRFQREFEAKLRRAGAVVFPYFDK